MQLVQRWWNGRFGRLARRDVWLEEGTVWQVRARKGDGDSRIKTWTFTNRTEADALVQRLLAVEPVDGWRDITDISANANTPIRGRQRPRPS
jgi:hypothetical protein